ncbi:MAG: tetratricopeptide repeat protein, partial [Henriciella sp.]|uniref:tetratricopeptide repeat protein n=1 Tax=Henriciella sp. TaxID=1968823 RepID=UPI003C76894E
MDDQQQQARQFAADGMQALQAGNGVGAEHAFKRAIDLGWPGADIWVTLSFAKSLQGDIKGRISALEKALETDPSSTRARLHLGQALVGDNRGEDARAHFEKGLADAKFLTQRSAEIEKLVQAASAFLGRRGETEDTDHPIDDFAREHGVGSEPEDTAF